VFKAERDGTPYLCGGKTSQGRPSCDGSHNRL
jgi:CDGSH-type Zn-finger protein